MADRWPRLLDRKDAAEYCSVSVNHFLAYCPVEPFEGFGSRRLWDRVAIDRWLDGGGNDLAVERAKWLERI